MAVERKDDGWIGDLLSQHTRRRELDLDAFTARIMTQVHASQGSPEETTARVRVPAQPGRVPRGIPGGLPGGPPARQVRVQRRGPRRRLIPGLVAAVSVLVVAAAGPAVSALARWTGQGERTSVVGTTPGPDLPSAGQGLPSPAQTSSLGAATTIVRNERLPSSFRWSSGAPVISPRTDAGGVIASKEPTVVRYGGKWHVFTTMVSASGYSLGYRSFTDWSEANSARLHTLDTSPIGQGFRSSPQVFYFAPQKLWYLVYQTGNASYSTNPDITDPNGWSAPKHFFAETPELIRKNLSDGGFWLDMWVVCDETDCHLFSSDNHGHLFRSQAPKASFPGGMSQPVIAAQDSGQGTSFAASSVYKVAGTGRYLLLSLAWDGSGHGYLRSWTSARIAGPWTALADSPTAPFAGTANIAFPSGRWTGDVVHGELIRDGYDQTMTVSPCRLRLLFFGLDHRFDGNSAFRLGLLTQTNSACS